MINDKKICFISCVNDNEKYEECLKYINNLDIPEGYITDSIAIRDAYSMTSAYNDAMRESDARYKVYLHQDTFIINKNFIQDTINIFNNHLDVGLLGVVGSKTVHESGQWDKSNSKFGKVYESRTGKMNIVAFDECNVDIENVKMVDGLIMITQYDLRWCEDLFDGWYFYDTSLSAEFIINGYKVAVPKQNIPWCIHDCGQGSIGKHYKKYNEIFVKKYLSNQKFMFFYFGNNSQIASGFEVMYPQGISIGENVTVLKDACFMIPFGNLKSKPLIEIEDGCEFGRRLVISAANKIKIGKKCIFASNIHITDHNHEYRNVGIPIIQQGITSFSDEVSIGDGTWIANNCVIVGNVNIGKGCSIGANSVVNSCIPDYCVAVGSPAKVIKAFDYVTGEWMKIKNEKQLTKIIDDRENAQPILSICIPTFNRSGYLDKCLKSIFDQVGNDSNIEVVVSDNDSDDNTKEIVDKYMNKFKNIRYFKNEENLGADKNVLLALKRGRGRFISAHGDDDYFAPFALYKIINKLYKNPNCGVFYLFNGVNTSEKVNCGIDNFIRDMSFYCTFISGIILSKCEFDNINNKDKFIGSNLNHVYLQLSIFSDNNLYCILHDYFLYESGTHKPHGYNFGETFIQNYLEILHYFRKLSISDETIKYEKKKLIEGMILPWCKKIREEDIKLDISDIEIYIKKYYKDETYLDELLAIISNPQ
ncbi:glycosyltransferase [Clostridium akagii]|uniref:glycosyltransferase n=1 Tax=Clostridium akagii TaxID=91623 RepID=UPI000A6565D0|nr:glycosyltransferase [Clostridium akagii]